LAIRIFDLVEKFAGYGFNKSHSAAYALVAYHTAWLKVHYPAEFMAAVISAEMHNTDKVVTFVDECHTMGLNVLPPEVNNCGYRFIANEEGHVVYGLGAIKGLGEGPIEAIVQARDEGVVFENLFDFCRRVDMKRMNRRSMEALVKAGALDQLGPNKHFNDRSSLLASLPDAMKAAEQASEDEAAGMGDLFGGPAADDAIVADVVWKTLRPWNDENRLNGEKDTLGLFLTGHPIDQFEKEISHFVSSRFNRLTPTEKGHVATVAGLVVQLRITRSKRSGERMAFMTLDDKTGRVEVSVFGRVFAEFADVIEKDELLVIRGAVRPDDYTGGFSIMADEILTMAEARERFARRLRLRVQTSEELPQWLRQHITPYQGGTCPVLLEIEHPDAMAEITLGEGWRVRPEQSLLNTLWDVLSPEQARIDY